MSRELICSVLGVPPESWPPNHYALIGLSPLEANPSRVEVRVQELSAKLRSFQLAHPDEVTDALNRLAQALVCLTDPAARTAYDSALKARDESAPYDVLPEPLPTRPTTPRHSAPASLEEARIAARRSRYRRLAAVRRLRSVWRDLEQWFGDSTTRITTLTDAGDMIRAAWAVRDALGSNTITRAGDGTIVAAMVREPHVLRLYRRRTPLQRSEMALDWQRGLAAIDRELRDLRRQVERPRIVPRRIAVSARWLVGDGLDLTLFLLGALALGIAIWRSQH